jgi:Xaa-Pro aminopeptidase
MHFDPDRISGLLRERRLDAIVATTRENILYLTGFDPITKSLNPYLGKSYAVLMADCPDIVHCVHPLGESDQILDATTVVGLTHFFGLFYREITAGTVLQPDERILVERANCQSNRYETHWEAFRGLIKRLTTGPIRLGLDEEGIDELSFSELREACSDATLVPCSDLFRLCRRKKTNLEIEKIGFCSKVAIGAYEDIFRNLADGVSEVDLRRSFERFLVERGVQPRLTMLRLGRWAVFGQRAQRDDVKYAYGDSVWLDCDCIFRGYWSDTARSLIPSCSTGKFLKYEALVKGQRFAIENIRPGMTGGQVFRMTMEAVFDAGFPEYRRHHVGHGIGLEPYERPILSPTSDDVVEEGNVLCIETPYYEYGVGGLHVEDPILVGRERNTLLSAGAADPLSLVIN